MTDPRPAIFRSSTRGAPNSPQELPGKRTAGGTWTAVTQCGQRSRFRQRYIPVCILLSAVKHQVSGPACNALTCGNASA